MVKSVSKELKRLVIFVVFSCIHETKKKQQFVQNYLKCKVNFCNYYCQIQKWTMKSQKSVQEKILNMFQLEMIYKMSTHLTQSKQKDWVLN